MLRRRQDSALENARRGETALSPQRLSEEGCALGKLKVQTEGIGRVNRKKPKQVEQPQRRERKGELEGKHISVYWHRHLESAVCSSINTGFMCAG